MTEIITMSIEEAKQSKVAFIQWINHIDLPQVAPWVNGWLEKYFTDEMANNFSQFYNGSYDDQEIILPSGEVLPSLIDDIEECMITFRKQIAA